MSLGNHIYKMTIRSIVYWHKINILFYFTFLFFIALQRQISKFENTKKRLYSHASGLTVLIWIRILFILSVSLISSMTIFRLIFSALIIPVVPQFMQGMLGDMIVFWRQPRSDHHKNEAVQHSRFWITRSPSIHRTIKIEKYIEKNQDLWKGPGHGRQTRSIHHHD